MRKRQKRSKRRKREKKRELSWRMSLKTIKNR